MVVCLNPKTTKEDVDKIISYIKDMGLDVQVTEGQQSTILGLIGDTSKIDPNTLMMNVHVDKVMRVAEPFKKASRTFNPVDTVVKVGNAEIGNRKKFTVFSSFPACFHF